MLNNRVIAAATALALATMAGCGSSNDDNNNGGGAPPAPPSSEIPPSAGTSAAAFIAFLLSLAASDTSEPLAVGTFTPPTDEVGEAQAI
ncbi:MAG: hypothetical protein H7X75_08175 [Burkholderiaceae bacterium]|nr:hypothetical protein [Burkholderiaceae bacterium]